MFVFRLHTLINYFNNNPDRRLPEYCWRIYKEKLFIDCLWTCKIKVYVAFHFIWLFTVSCDDEYIRFQFPSQPVFYQMLVGLVSKILWTLCPLSLLIFLTFDTSIASHSLLGKPQIITYLHRGTKMCRVAF